MVNPRTADPTVFAARALTRARRAARARGYERLATNDAIFGVNGNRKRQTSRDIETLSGLFDKFRETPAVARNLLLPEIVKNWPSIVGDAVAQHTTPESLSIEGCLRIATSSTAWATSLGLLGSGLIERIHEVTGTRKVTSIYIAPPLPKMKITGPLRAKDAVGYRDTFG